MKEKIYDTIVIGAGQAGLAAGYWLRNTGLNFLILEAGPSPAGSWPQYYESLLLFTPESYSRLPGLRMGTNSNFYPGRNDMIAYLKKYAEHFCLPVRVDTKVLQVEKSGTGFLLKTSVEDYQARTVINATGSYNHPHIPHFPGQELFPGKIIHSYYYQGPEGLKGSRVVVVGAGNSAIQIADELKDVAKVTFTSRRPVKWINQRILGKDIHWWMGIAGIDSLPLRKKPKGRIPVLDTGKYRQALKLDAFNWKPMFRALTSEGVTWSDGITESVDVLILATGFINKPEWLTPLDIFDSRGEMKQTRGVFRNVPGLFFTGFFLQRTPASGNIRGASFDAEYIVRRLLVHLKLRSCPNWLDVFVVNWRQRWRKMQGDITQRKNSQ